MNELRAFVGHSFTEDDESVVQAFLKFLDQVKNLGIGFSWEHAKPAEPKLLAEKVLRLTADKNLFIGICTRKERAVSQDSLKKSFLKANTLCVLNDDLWWKTSDWIIQEIGLAIGRGMDVILLLENGVRAPDGLQGDLEYIPFYRASPEKSFNKLLEMIRALLPRARAVIGGAAEGPAMVVEESTKQEEGVGEKWLEPKPDWNRQKYGFALMRMIAVEDRKGEEKIYQAYLATEQGRRRDNQESWEAAREYLKVSIGKGGSLRALESLVERYSNNSEVRCYLAKGYEKYKEYEKAAATFRASADAEKDPKRRLTRLRDSAIAFARIEDEAALSSTIAEMKALARNLDSGEALILIIDALKEVAEMRHDHDAFLAFAERFLDLQPDDNSARFASL